VILCDEWSDGQVKSVQVARDRSATWAAFDEELLALELQQLNESDYDLSLTGFDPGEIDGLLAIPDEERTNAAPPLPENPVSRAGDLCSAASIAFFAEMPPAPRTSPGCLGERKPILMVTDPPYGIELDSEWRDRAGLNGCGPAEASYMKNRTAGHTETTISGDTRADWSEPSSWCRVSRLPMFGMPPSLPGRCWTASCASGWCITSKSSGTKGERC